MKDDATTSSHGTDWWLLLPAALFVAWTLVVFVVGRTL